MRLILAITILGLLAMAVKAQGSNTADAEKPSKFSDCTCTCSPASTVENLTKSRQKRGARDNDADEEEEAPSAGSALRQGGRGGYRQRYGQNVRSNSGAGGFGAAATGAYGRGGMNRQHLSGSGHQFLHSNGNTVYGPTIIG